MIELSLGSDGGRMPAERARLRELKRYHLLDTAPEASYDELVRLAALLCESPMASVTLIDEQRQWFKASVGLDICETPRAISLCAHAIESSATLEVPDASQDERFRTNPLVQGPPAIRHFAGVPLTTPAGHNIGTLSVFDVRPRTLSAAQHEALILLARQVMRQFDAGLANRAVAERLAMHQALLDGSGQAVVSVDGKGVIAGVNAAAEELLDYAQAELLGQPVSLVFPTLTLPAAGAQAGAHGSPCRRRDGSLADALVQAYSLGTGENGAPLGVAIVARGPDQAAELQQRMQNIASQLPGMVFQAIRMDNGDFTLAYVSDAIEDIFGIAAACAGANPGVLRAAVHTGDLAALQDSIRQATPGLQQWRAEFRVCHPVKGVLWVEGRAMAQSRSEAATHWYGVLTDITERKQQQLTLDTQLETNRLLLESLAEGVVICDAQGRLTLFNDAAKNWFGDNSLDLPPEQWQRQFVLYRPGEDAPMPAQDWPLMQAMAGHQVREMEFSIIAEGMPPRHLTANAQPLRGGDGSLLGAVVVMHDVTERKHVELRQREFVSTVSHELRTPLTSISGSLGLLRGGALGAVPEAMRAMLDIAHQNSLRLSHLINDLLDMDKLVAGKMHFDLRQHALKELLEQSLQANESYAQQHGVVLLLESLPAVQIQADAMRLQQVLANFLSNAIKFSAPGAEVRVRGTLHNARVRIAVLDQGSGIPQAFHARIFQKFSQVDSSDRREKGGTGLGLSISKELVERMGGEIGFDSVEGEGSSFWCELPLGVDVLPDGADGALPVLVVEDEPDIALLLGILLEQAGYTTVWAAGLAHARELVAHHAFAAVTVDLGLGDGNGVDLIRDLRAAPATCTLPVLVISARNEEGRLLLDGCFEAVDWFDKPIDAKRLIEVLQRRVPRGACKPRILHLEDDADLCKVIAQQLKGLAHMVPAHTLAEARELLAGDSFDLILTDLMLPDGNGLELVAELQRHRHAIPVVVLSAQELSQNQLSLVQGAFAKSRSEPARLLSLLRHLLQEKGGTTCQN